MRKKFEVYKGTDTLMRSEKMKTEKPNYVKGTKSITQVLKL